eukprot:UN30089
MGKLYHPGHPADNDEPKSWTANFQTNKRVNITLDNQPVTRCNSKNDTCTFHYVNPDSQIQIHEQRKNKDGVMVDFQPFCKDLPDKNCTDYWLAESAVDMLDVLEGRKDKGRPFFLGIGFHKPHPFWAVPQRFQDMYKDMQLPTNLKAPKGSPEDVSFYSCKAIDTRSESNGPYCND